MVCCGFLTFCVDFDFLRIIENSISIKRVGCGGRRCGRWSGIVFDYSAKKKKENC